jgi:zinc/manganese transport system substrate-binding protein
VVTTNILGDIVAATVGDLADVEVIMPGGADPHDFAPSVRQAEAMENADLLIINGAGFEQGLVDIIANAADAGTEIFAFADHVDLLGLSGDDDHADDSADPHIWTDPSRMAEAVASLGEELATIDGIDVPALADQVDAYVADLAALDREIEQELAAIAEDERVLVTTHQVFGYFADRFDFEVVGAIVPSSTTTARASAAGLEELTDLIAAEGIPAIFAETTQSTQLADALADSVGPEVRVVELFTESLGEPGRGADTYVAMRSTNAELIAEAHGS